MFNDPQIMFNETNEIIRDILHSIIIAYKLTIFNEKEK